MQLFVKERFCSTVLALMVQFLEKYAVSLPDEKKQAVNFLINKFIQAFQLEKHIREIISKCRENESVFRKEKENFKKMITDHLEA